MASGRSTYSKDSVLRFAISCAYGGVMKVIMESKNAIVDSVLKMMQAMFVTQNKVMSAGMAR